MSCTERCAPGGQSHEHCVCGLPMGVRERTCWLCQLEGLDPKSVGGGRRLRSPAVWDGRTYLSRRRRPRCCHDPELFDWLLTQIFWSRAAIEALRAATGEGEVPFVGHEAAQRPPNADGERGAPPPAMGSVLRGTT
jgi:hypothetical protein